MIDILRVDFPTFVYQFDGTKPSLTPGGRAQLITTQSFTITPSQFFTIEFWFYYWQNGTFLTYDNIELIAENGYILLGESSIPLAAGQIGHLALKYSGELLTLWINGNEVGEVYTLPSTDQLVLENAVFDSLAFYRRAIDNTTILSHEAAFPVNQYDHLYDMNLFAYVDLNYTDYPGRYDNAVLDDGGLAKDVHDSPATWSGNVANEIAYLTSYIDWNGDGQVLIDGIAAAPDAALPVSTATDISIDAEFTYLRDLKIRLFEGNVISTKSNRRPGTLSNLAPTGHSGLYTPELKGQGSITLAAEVGILQEDEITYSAPVGIKQIEYWIRPNASGTLSLASRNLLQTSSASFETGTNGWSGYAATSALASVAGNASHGSNSMRVTSTAGGTSGAISALSPCTAGLAYSFGFYAVSPLSFQLFVGFYNSAGTLISQPGVGLGAPPGGAGRLTWNNVVAPANAVNLRINIEAISVPASGSYHIDAVQYEQATAATAFEPVTNTYVNGVLNAAVTAGIWSHIVHQNAAGVTAQIVIPVNGELTQLILHDSVVSPAVRYSEKLHPSVLSYPVDLAQFTSPVNNINIYAYDWATL